MAEFHNPPLSRHEALAPLSRDHYVGLVQAQHLIKAAGDNAVVRRTAVAEFVDAWDQALADHFDVEERLLSHLADQTHRQRLHDDHQALREMADQIRQQRQQVEPDCDLLRAVGQRLEQHIRWEERELFTHLQRSLSDDQLSTLQQQTAKLEAARPRQVRGQ